MIDTAYINLTVLCNYECIHCYTGISGPIRRKGELDNNKMKELLNKLKDNGIKSLVIVGGEPMLRRDFIELLVVSSLLFKSVTVETNGSIFKPYLIEIIKEYELNNITFWTSIEGATEEENSIIRGSSTLENSILFIKKLKSANIPIGIRSTLYNERIDYKKVIELAEKLGVQVTFVRFLPVGRGKQLNIAPNKERIAEAYEYVSKHDNATLYDCPFYIYNTKLASKFIDRFKEEGGVCGVRSMRRIFVTEEAKVYSCVFTEEDKYYLGDALNDKWEDIIKNYKKLVNNLNKIEAADNCKNCKYYKEGYCKGGCAVYPLIIKKGSDIDCPIPLLEKKEVVNYGREVIKTNR